MKFWIVNPSIVTPVVPASIVKPGEDCAVEWSRQYRALARIRSDVQAGCTDRVGLVVAVAGLHQDRVVGLGHIDRGLDLLFGLPATRLVRHSCCWN